ncbi:hypothetical protein E2C01_071829 [Portunus trituberculatus]|uniref:Uncharacterized protein n=1 Tax=Portunus trituberculatus TaxID=210409 RepID=A0A5B7I7A7_PORTR|nr:hypothetical protein [Portunus trituberculatus]
MIRGVSRLRSASLLADRSSGAPAKPIVVRLTGLPASAFSSTTTATFSPIFSSIHIFLPSIFFSLPFPPLYPQLMSSDSFFFLSSLSSPIPIPSPSLFPSVPQLFYDFTFIFLALH